jgi:hypothetical protein
LENKIKRRGFAEHDKGSGEEVDADIQMVYYGEGRHPRLWNIRHFQNKNGVHGFWMEQQKQGKVG